MDVHDVGTRHVLASTPRCCDTRPAICSVIRTLDPVGRVRCRMCVVRTVLTRQPAGSCGKPPSTIFDVSIRFNRDAQTSCNGPPFGTVFPTARHNRKHNDDTPRKTSTRHVVREYCPSPAVTATKRRYDIAKGV